MKPSDKFAPRDLSDEQKRAIRAEERIAALEDANPNFYADAVQQLRELWVWEQEQAARRRFGIDWD